MSLTHNLDLDIVPLDLHAEIQVRMFDRLAMRVLTDTHRHTDDVKTKNYYTRHVSDVGCIKKVNK